MDSAKNHIALAIVALAAAGFPLVVRDSYNHHLMILVFIWVIIGTSWNLLAGYTGQVSFGHAAFFGMGAYAAGLAHFQLGISPWWGMAYGGFAAIALGVAIGFICFRLRGPYFALATLAAAEILRLIANNWVDFTSGMVGIQIIPTFRSKLPYYYMALALAAGCLLAVYGAMRSKWGYYFLSIREDQDAAESFGIATTLYKNISLAVSAFFTGMAGAFYMNYMAFIDPAVVFSLPHISIMAILVVILGGVATIWGPALGALLMVMVQEMFRTSLFGLAPKWFGRSHVLAFGILVILIIRFMPGGLVGDWARIKRAFSGFASRFAKAGGG